MIIKTGPTILSVAKAKAPAIAEMVKDPARPVSISADIARQFDIAVGPEVLVTPHFIVRGLDLGALSNDETKAFQLCAAIGPDPSDKPVTLPASAFRS